MFIWYWMPYLPLSVGYCWFVVISIGDCCYFILCFSVVLLLLFWFSLAAVLLAINLSLLLSCKRTAASFCLSLFFLLVGCHWTTDTFIYVSLLSWLKFTLILIHFYWYLDGILGYFDWNFCWFWMTFTCRSLTTPLLLLSWLFFSLRAPL